MTLNLTPEDYATTRDFAVITNDPADVAAIETTFNADFTNAAITPPTGDNLVWSPTNSRAALTSLIDGATQSLLISQEEFADTALQTTGRSGPPARRRRHPRPGESRRQILLRAQRAQGRGRRIAIYSSRTGYYIHAKTVLADYGTPQASLFVGSENFSTDSLNDNRELGLVFYDPGCINGVHTAITADFNNGTKF